MSSNTNPVQKANNDHVNGTTSDTTKMSPQDRDVYLTTTKKLKGN